MSFSKSYLEMLSFKTFEERYEYLKTTAKVGEETFGSKRYLNQILYKTKEWKKFRDKVILRDNGCDLGCEDRMINSKIIVHHINPISIDDVLNQRPCVFDLNNVVCVSFDTHQAIHYGTSELLPKDPIVRTKNDTCPWKTDTRR